MRKKQFIEVLREGERVDDLFLVKSSRLAETRAGKPYLILEVTDKSGDISGPIWDNAERMAEVCRVGNFIHLRGQVQSYREKLQLRIEAVQAVSKDDVSLADFVVASRFDLEEMAMQVREIVASVENSWVRKLLDRFFQEGEIWQRFKIGPAAKGIHHAYVGGLMEHCLSMARVADSLARHYEGIDRSILLAGVFFHDIGKLWELEDDNGVVDYTIAGRLKGHIVIGCEKVAEEAAKIADFPEDILVRIQHLILSHHGKLEFASPTVPMTPEAFILSYIDDLDSKMNLFEQLRRKHKGENAAWSDYQRTLERYLLVEPLGRPHETIEPQGPPEPRVEETEKVQMDDMGQHIQGKLF